MNRSELQQAGRESGLARVHAAHRRAALAPTPRTAPFAAASIAACSIALGLVALGLAGCAIPGKLYRVTPAISGQLPPPDVEVELLLRVMHRESPRLHQDQTASLSGSGRFSFHEVDLEVAGHEYSKHYRVYLHRRAGKRDRVIWRADIDRRALAGPIELDCDLERPAVLGEPCQVQDPTRQPWLVAGGARTFGQLCARCHGADASGSGKGIVKGSPAAPDLRRIAARREGRFDRTEIATWIEGRSLPGAHVARQMPVWGERLSKQFERYAEGDELVGAELDPVLAYLQSVQLPATSASP